MHYQALLVGNFIKAGEFGTGEIPAQPTWTISRVALEKLESIAMADTESATGKLKTKGIVYFKEIGQGWVLNRTNIMCLVEMWGADTDGWVGKRVTLFAADVRVGPKMDKGIRIKGSPDLTREVTVSVKLPRRKPIPMKLVPTKANGAASAHPVPPPDEAMSVDEVRAAISKCGTVDDLKAAWKSCEPKMDEGVMQAAKEAYMDKLAQIRESSHE